MVYTPKTAELLKKLRNEYKHCTQEEFANTMAIGRSGISKKEGAKENLNVEYLLNILDWFKKTKSKKDYRKFLLELFK